jgi:ABC-type sugar transport system substrate-binding protein
VLENRGRGVQQGLKANGMSGTSLQNVEVDPTANFSHWQQLSQANADAKALVGLCAPDIESLGKVNKLGGNKFVAGGYDLTTGNINAIRNGNAYVTLGQNPYVQGYLPVVMLIDAIKNKQKLKAGFIDSGSEIVTKDKVTEPYGLPALSLDKLVKTTASASSMRAYYRPLLVSGKLKNWKAHIEPIANEAKVVAK